MIEALKTVTIDMVSKDPQITSQQPKKMESNGLQEGKQKEASEKELKKAVNEINDAFKSMNIQRQFVIDKNTEQVVVKILDTDKNEVIRQIPSEDALRISKNIKEMIGLLFDSKS